MTKALLSSLRSRFRWKSERLSAFNIALIGVFVLAALIRLAPISIFMHYSPRDGRYATYVGDARGYKDFALQISESGMGSLLFDTTDHSQTAPVTAFRTPLYPMFIAAIFEIFGSRPEPVLFAQVLLDLCTLWLVYLIARRLAPSRWIALASAALYALDPLSAMYAASMYAECFFVFFVAAGIYAFLRAIDASTARERWWRLAFLGVVLGLGTLAKPIGVYAAFMYVPALFIGYRSSRRSWSQAALATVMVLTAFAATIAPWQLRNLYVYGHYSLTFQQGREILVWRVGTCRAHFEKIPRQEMWASIQAPYLSIPDYFERSKAEQAEAVAYIESHPGNMLACHLAGIRHLFFTDDLFFTNPNGGATPVASRFLDRFGDSFKAQASRLYAISQYIAYALAAVGIGVLFADRRRRAAAVLFASLFFYIAQASSVDGYSRYAAPLQPMLAALIAVGAGFLIHRYRRAMWGIL